MVTVTFLISRTGLPVEPGAEPPGFMAWAGARMRFERVEGDYAPGVLRPGDRVDTRAGPDGRGSVYLLPGRYLVTLPSNEGRHFTLGDDTGPEVDLSLLLAGGVEPIDPQYQTLIGYVDERVGAVGLSPAHIGAAAPTSTPWPFWWIRPGEPAVLFYHAGSGVYLQIGAGTAPVPDPDPIVGLFPGPNLYPGAGLYPGDGELLVIFPGPGLYPGAALYPLAAAES